MTLNHKYYSLILVDSANDDLMILVLENNYVHHLDNKNHKRMYEKFALKLKQRQIVSVNW